MNNGRIIKKCNFCNRAKFNSHTLCISCGCGQYLFGQPALSSHSNKSMSSIILRLISAWNR